MSTDTRTPAEIRYDAERDGMVYIKPADDYEKKVVQVLAEDGAAEPATCPTCDANSVCDACQAAEDAANCRKVFDLVAAALEGDTQSLFSDTLPGRVNGTPMDIVVGIHIGALIEGNLSQLGITRDQMFDILEVAVNPVVEKYLITPARRLGLLWDGMD